MSESSWRLRAEPSETVAPIDLWTLSLIALYFSSPPLLSFSLFIYPLIHSSCRFFLCAKSAMFRTSVKDAL